MLGAECLGSLDYALTNLGESLKLFVVLGHSGCGAVTAAVDAFIDVLTQSPGHCLKPPIAGDCGSRVRCRARGACRIGKSVYSQQVEESPGYRKALIETSVVLNAAVTAASLADEFSGQLGPERAVVFGVYNLHSKRVCIDLEPDRKREHSPGQAAE